MVDRGGAHEVLAEPVAKPPGPDALLASARRAKMDETERLDINALGDPAEHSTTMTVDAVPHDLAHEAADLFETGNAVELGHADRHLVPADLWHQLTALRVDEPR